MTTAPATGGVGLLGRWLPAELRPFGDYQRLWWARILGTGAQQWLMVTLAWRMYEVTGSAWDLGLVGLLQFVPSMLWMLPAGRIIDTHRRSRIIVGSLAAQAAVALAAAAAAWWPVPEREGLLLLCVVLGCVKAFQMPAQQALLPSLVSREALPRAVAFASSGLQVAIIAAPAIAGWAYVLGTTRSFLICALLYTLALLYVARIADGRPTQHTAPGLAGLLAGVRHVAQHRALLGAMALDLLAVLLGGATALLPIYADKILHVGPVGLGLLRSAPAVGALVMSLVLLRWPLVQRRAGPRMLWAVAAYGLCMVVFGLSTQVWLSWAALALSGVADMASVVIRQTLVQLETPDPLRGRVSAVNALFIGASNQLGEFESGAVAAWLGPVPSVVLGGVGAVLAAAVWPFWFRELAQRDRLVALTDDAGPPSTSPTSPPSPPSPPKT